MLRFLLETSVDRDSPLLTLATMRSDFMNAFQVFPGTADRFKEIPLNPMRPARFGEVIEGPADRFGLHLEPGLTNRLIEDTRHDDALPLLAFTLKELHAASAQEEGELSIEVYERLFPAVQVHSPDGTTTSYRGVSAAIKHTADKILEETGYSLLATDDPRMRDLRRAFFNLAQVGAEGQFTRCTAHWSQMPSSCEGILKRFAGPQQRLLVSGSEEGEPTLKVAHEALFRVWDTLNGWLRHDRKVLSLRNQIEDAAADWDAEGRTESRAWPEERILDAVKEIDRSGVSLDDAAQPEVVRAFLGPTDSNEIVRLPAFGVDEDATKGSGHYGYAWRMPLSHKARASLGVRLALLGDPRRGVGLRADGLPDIEWCPIKAGEVTIKIRSDPDDPNSEVADTRTREVAQFSIARYPVTIAQFQAFLDDCYQGGQWCLPTGFPAAQMFDYAPRFRSRYGNHPADSVNWYDAAAYCYWLSTRLGTEVRLPTEFEWQLAATSGDPESIYPWGRDWNPEQVPWRANTFESGLGQSTAVGVYPAGASQAGVLDLAGNLYEWCLNMFNDPDDIAFPVARRDPRTIRGGSWNRRHRLAQCASRNWLNPAGRYYDVGFRVMCSLPTTNR